MRRVTRLTFEDTRTSTLDLEEYVAILARAC